LNENSLKLKVKGMSPKMLKIASKSKNSKERLSKLMIKTDDAALSPYRRDESSILTPNQPETAILNKEFKLMN
jgi:hypothetical protein